MDISEFNNKVVIVHDNMKDNLLSLISESSELYNIKIITLSELKKKYLFDYDKRSIYHICNNYNVNYNIAMIYLNNLYYINKECNECSFLCDLKDDLDNNNLLIYNDLFKDFLEHSDIVLFDLKNIDLFYINIFNSLKEKTNVIEYELDDSYDKKKIYLAYNIEEEVSFVASKICNLIKEGISINNIKLANVNSDYYYVIKKVFKMFHLNINLREINTYKGTNFIKVFKDNYCSDIDKTLTVLESLVVDEDSRYLYKQIINIINDYSFIEDYDLVKDLIFYEVDNIKVKSIKYKNAIEVIDIEHSIINDDEYVFLINFNEGIIPINNKDEDYFSDKIRNKLNISTSIDLNKKAILSVTNAIKRVKNIIVSFISYDNKGPVYISPSFSEEVFYDIEEVSIPFDSSNLFNKLKLVTLKDEHNKYGVIKEETILLNNHYKNEKYLDYSNNYTKINTHSLNEYLNNKLTLSYTSINSYNECAFKYYLNYILKLNKYEDSFEIVVGNIFHKILSICFNDNFDFESSFNSEVKSCNYVFNNSEKFFLHKLKNDLIKIIETIKNQLKYTSLTKSMYEKEIIINIDEKCNVTFKGFVDKLLYEENDTESIVVIIDYKTGNPNININNSIYGLDMQLPIYIYLVKRSNIIKNVRIGGMYLQKILPNSLNEEDKMESLKLQGYSNSDLDVLSKVDSSYQNSKIIKGLKMSNNGFYNYSKVISDENIDKLCDIVDNNIHSSSKKILNGEFDINPKKIKDVNKGCLFCKYRDICYMNNEDIVELQYIKDIFGGEE